MRFKGFKSHVFIVVSHSPIISNQFVGKIEMNKYHLYNMINVKYSRIVLKNDIFFIMLKYSKFD